jgi:hypothetical protein
LTLSRCQGRNELFGSNVCLFAGSDKSIPRPVNPPVSTTQQEVSDVSRIMNEFARKYNSFW